MPLLSVMACACSVGGGGLGSVAFPGPSHSNFGVRSNVRVDMEVFDWLPPLSAGLDAQLLTRHQDDADWSQWRLGVPLGFTRMPNHSQFILGCEAYFVGGISQYLTPEGKPRRRLTPGVEFGAPIRLSRWRPTWRSDDITSGLSYLVPHAGYTWFGDSYEVSYGLSFRARFWSSIVP